MIILKTRVRKYNEKTMPSEPVSGFMGKTVLERAAALESMRREIIRRMQQFNSRNLYSFGLESLKDKMNTSGFNLEKNFFNESLQELGTNLIDKSESTMKFAQVHAYSLMREFLDPKETQTSTLAGIYASHRQQDILVFGADPVTGKPLKTLGKGKKGQEMRRKFWALVDTLRNSDVITPAYDYFFTQSAFTKLWKSSNFQRLSPEAMIEKALSLIKNEIGEAPPLAQHDAVDGVEEGKNGDDLAYLTSEFLSTLERRNLL